MSSSRPWYILPVIVLAQFAGTSLWFAGNAVLAGHTGLSVAGLTAIVQAGFITGTLVFALFTLADAIAPVKLFFVCALLGALANAAIASVLNLPLLILVLRFATGFFLAGIYPVGMKIAADWFPEGLGKALGWLVGALVAGTAFPHLVRASLVHAAPAIPLYTISLIAFCGGLLLIWLVPSASIKKQGQIFQPGVLGNIWQEKHFRSAAFGYLGHMWELYTFWAFVPVLLLSYNSNHSTELPIALLSFLVIGAGALGCILGGIWSQRKGSAWVCSLALTGSGACCLLLPLMLQASAFPFIIYLVIWGMLAVTDSPQLSALAAQTAPPHLKGTALTLLTSAGFFLTVLSLLVVEYLAARYGQTALVVLAIGPFSGWWALRPLRKMANS